MSTPVSALTPYCSVAEFLTRYDWRPVMQLMSDDDSQDPLRNTLTDSTTTEGARLLAILQDASGELETAALLGGRYTVADLQALTGNQVAYIRRITADLAIGRCFQRRPDLFGQPPNQTQVAQQVLNALASGDRIFGLQETIDASHLEMTTNTEANVLTRNSMVVAAQEYFGRRGNRDGPRRA